MNNTLTSQQELTARRMDIANNIRCQIPSWLRMAVGFRSAVVLESGLQFDCRGRGNYRVVVEYDTARDLYNVTVWTKSRAPRAFYTADGIFNDDMVAIVDMIDRGTLSA